MNTVESLWYFNKKLDRNEFPMRMIEVKDEIDSSI